MTTLDEISQRIREDDDVRSARRIAAARQVADLARRREEIAEQLRTIDEQLGTVLTEAQDVMSVIELSRFTDIPRADLEQWLHAQAEARTKRKRSTSRRTAGSVDARRRINSAAAQPSEKVGAQPSI